MLSVRCLSVLSVCLSVLSVTFVHCGQTVGRIKMKLGTQVGLGSGHIVLDGDPAPPRPKGYSPHPIFGPYLLRPNGCMDQDTTWYGARPQPGDFVLDGDPAVPSPRKGAEPLPSFWPISIVVKRLLAACIKMPLSVEVGLSPGDFVWEPSPLNFRPMFIIVIVISLEHCTKHSRYWFIQVQVLYSMHSIFRKV